MPAVAVGVVLDGRDRGRHAVLVPLEVDDAVALLVAATAVAGGLATVVVAAAGAGLLGRAASARAWSLVISEKSETVWNRRPGAGGLALAKCHGLSSSNSSMRVALDEGDDGPLGVGPLAVGDGAAVALALALAVERVHLGDPHVEDRLDGVADLDLVGVGVDEERVDVLVEQRVATSRSRSAAMIDVAGVPHSAVLLRGRSSVGLGGLGLVASARPLIGPCLGAGRRWPRPCRRRRCRQRVLGEHDPVADQHVVGVELGGLEDVDVGQVAEALGGGRVLVARGRPATLPSSRGRRGRRWRALVLGASKPQPSTTTTLSSAARSDSAERRARRTIFLGVRWRVAAGLRAEGHAAAPPVRARGSSPGGPGRCPSAATAWRHRRAPRRGSWCRWVPARRAASWAVTTWCITGTLGSMPNDVVVEVDRAGLLAAWRASRRCWPSRALPSPRRGRGRAPPLGPGTAPLTSSRSRSASAWTTSRLRVVTSRRPCDRPCGCP